MCGIVGYIGDRQAQEIILEGLKRLEYRGYDSSGLAIADGQELRIERAVGKLGELVRKLTEPIPGNVGVGHTRWATHGSPTEENAHPHEADGVVVVHNGIIENYLSLKEELKSQGCVFKSETDTEVICHLIRSELKRGSGFEDAVRNSLARLRGSYGLVILWRGDPGRLIAARKESPLVLGLGEGENFVASDIPAILHHTRDMIFLDDGEMAVVEKDKVRVSKLDGTPVHKGVHRIDWSPVMAEKGGFPPFHAQGDIRTAKGHSGQFQGKDIPGER
jgi:glucosamine--fructose-6-phosphate aminotransferase (isomerizing)